MKKQIGIKSKWVAQVKYLLISLEQEINVASKVHSLKDLEISIHKKEFQEQLNEIDSLLLSWIRDLKFWEKVHLK